MITIEFKAENVSQLKNDILAYARELAPTPKQVDPPMYVEEKPKAKAAAKEKPVAAKVEAKPEPVAPPPAPAIPSDKEVQDALVAVNDKHGIDKAVECLTKFGVKRGREIKDEQKAAFVAHCNSVM